MNKFPWLSKDRLGSQQESPNGSLPPRAISFVVHVLPPSKLTPSSIPAVSPASLWPTFVTITMLLGLVGLTAIVSSDSFRCRWLTLTLAGTAADATTRAAAGRPPASQALSPPQLRSQVRSGTCQPSLAPARRAALLNHRCTAVISASTTPHSLVHIPQYERLAENWEAAAAESLMPVVIPARIVAGTAGWKSAHDHAFSGVRGCRVWEAHHAERIEHPNATGENRNEKCYLKGQVPGICVDANDLVLDLLGVVGELLLKLRIAHYLSVSLQRMRDLLLLGWGKHGARHGHAGKAGGKRGQHDG